MKTETSLMLTAVILAIMGLMGCSMSPGFLRAASESLDDMNRNQQAINAQQNAANMAIYQSALQPARQQVNCQAGPYGTWSCR